MSAIARIQVRRDTAARLNTTIPLSGEPVYSTDTTVLKIGSGVIPWTALDSIVTSNPTNGIIVPTASNANIVTNGSQVGMIINNPLSNGIEVNNNNRATGTGILVNNPNSGIIVNNSNLNGVSVNTPGVYGVSVNGSPTQASLYVTGTPVCGLKIAPTYNTTIPTGILINGLATTGVNVSSQSTTGINVSGGSATGISISGQTTTGLSISGANSTPSITLTNAISISGNPTNGINIGGKPTNGINIGSNAFTIPTGIQIGASGIVTNALDINNANTTKKYCVGGVQVVGAQQAGVKDSQGLGDIQGQFNLLLSQLRAHGLINPNVIL